MFDMKAPAATKVDTPVVNTALEKEMRKVKGPLSAPLKILISCSCPSMVITSPILASYSIPRKLVSSKITRATPYVASILIVHIPPAASDHVLLMYCPYFSGSDSNSGQAISSGSQ